MSSWRLIAQVAGNRWLHTFLCIPSLKLLKKHRRGIRTVARKIDEGTLRGQLVHVENISETQRVQFNMTHGHPSLDDGERDLIIYAETFDSQVWLLNSPDMAAVRFCHKQGWLQRLVSLGAMTSHLKTHLREDLRINYTEGWLSVKRTDLLLGIG